MNETWKDAINKERAISSWKKGIQHLEEMLILEKEMASAISTANDLTETKRSEYIAKSQRVLDGHLKEIDRLKSLITEVSDLK